MPAKRYQPVLTEEQKREKAFDDLEEIRANVKILAYSIAVLAGATVFYFFIKLGLAATAI